jgi:hypothetical protein
MALSGRTLSKHVGKDAGSVVVRDGLFLAAATALLSLAGCTNLGAPLLIEGAPLRFASIRIPSETCGECNQDKAPAVFSAGEL